MGLQGYAVLRPRSRKSQAMVAARPPRHEKRSPHLPRRRGDTTMSMPLSSYIDVIKKYGFKEIACFDCVKKESKDKSLTRYKDKQYVYYHDTYGFLLTFDTFYANTVVNSGKVFYQFLFNDMENIRISSGHGISKCGKSINSEPLVVNSVGIEVDDPHIPKQPERLESEDFKAYAKKIDEYTESKRKYMKENNLFYIWSGDHDCREGIIYNLTNIVKESIPLVDWEEFDTGILIYLHDHNSDLEWDDENSIGYKRIKSLPEYVLKNIKFIK